MQTKITRWPRLNNWLAAKAATLLRFRIDGTGYGSWGNSSTGISVTADRALTSATFFACMNLIGGTIAYLGFDLMREKKSGGADSVSDHPLSNVLHWEPNSHIIADEFFQRLVWDQELTGDGFAKISRNSSGVIGLIPWDPERVTLDHNVNPWRYKYQPPIGGPETLEERDVLHVRNVTRDGIRGISTVALAKERLGLDLAVEKYGAMFFGKGGRVKDIFEYAGTLTGEQRAQWRKLFQDEYGNLDSAHGALLMEAGFQYKGSSGANPDDAQFVETQTSSAVALCRFTGVPPTLVGILDRATYNNQEQLMLQFLTLGIAPRVQRLEKFLRRSLLTDQEKRNGFYIHSNLNKLMRADMRTRAEFYKALAGLMALSPNDIRDLEDMPRIPNPAADEYRLAVNIFGPQGPQPQPPAADQPNSGATQQ